MGWAQLLIVRRETLVLVPRPQLHLRKCPEHDRLGCASEELFRRKPKESGPRRLAS